MSTLEGFVADLEKFVTVNKEVIILVVIVTALVVGVGLWMRRIRREDRQYYEERNLSCQPEVQQPINPQTDLSVLKECQRRANELLSRFTGDSREKYIRFFDEDLELSGDGFMYSLMRMSVDGRKVWVIFYPNVECNIILLVFDRRISWDKVVENETIIDIFYDGEGKLFGDEDDYPAYVWDDDDNCDFDSLKEDLAKAAQVDSSWNELLLQFSEENT